ncbi:MAG: J domain-containing protein [Vicinamibacterales bacterium]
MDFYAILGLDRAAALGDIKRAYKRLARRYHPDINPGDRMASAHFRQIVEAYETLSDPDRRRRYDATGQAVVATETSAYGFEGFDFSISVSGSAASTFGDLFTEALGQREMRRQEGPAERGADLHQTITIGFEEAIRGGEWPLTVTRQGRCRTCRGAGWLQVTETPCPQCKGAGIVKSARGHMVFSRPCAACGGSGQQRRSRCPACAGQQTETRTEPLMVSVPPGISDGSRVRIAGKGHVGRNGSENGDLDITVRVEPHPLFRREGDDLHVTVPVAVHEAALGARIDVPSLDGPVRLRVPPGTQSGQRFRLRDRGAPSPRGARRGDLVIEARVVLPTLLDERSKELLREFGTINDEDVRRDLHHPRP